MQISIKTKSGNFRMFQWLLIAIVLYTLAAMLASQSLLSQVQTIFWKLGHETIAAFVGYWIDRSAFRIRLNDESVPLHHIRRAVIIGATMLAVALGM